MKKIILSLSLFVSIGNFLIAQNKCEIKEFATIPVEKIRADDKNTMPSFKTDDLKFSSSGNYLFAAWGSTIYGGGIMIYDMKDKVVSKVLKINSNSDGDYGIYFAINPRNEMEIAVQMKKREVVILSDWKSANENILNDPRSDANVKCSVINSKSELYGEWSFSGDGDLFYLRGGTDFKVVDKITGEVKNEKSFSGKRYEFLRLATEDNILLIVKQGKKDKYVKREIDIYDIKKDSIIRTAVLPDMSLQFGLGGNNRFISSYGNTYDILSDKMIQSSKEAYNKVYNETGKMAKVYPIPNVDGNLVDIADAKMSFFSSSDNQSVAKCPTGTDIKNITSYQFSSNGKYFVYTTSSSNVLYIWEMY